MTEQSRSEQLQQAFRVKLQSGTAPGFSKRHANKLVELFDQFCSTRNDFSTETNISLRFGQYVKKHI